jgi:hypothetical protein
MISAVQARNRGKEITGPWSLREIATDREKSRSRSDYKALDLSRRATASSGLSHSDARCSVGKIFLQPEWGLGELQWSQTSILVGILANNFLSVGGNVFPRSLLVRSHTPGLWTQKQIARNEKISSGLPFYTKALSCAQ